jgi:putative two-component system response regulator
MIKEETGKNARILIVDDQDANVLLLERLLETAGYKNFMSTKDPRQVLPLFGKFQPDLILLDLMMPHLDGFSVMQQIGPRVPDGDYLPILVLTADMNAEVKRKALATGARDFLSKPLDATEVLLRIKNLLETRFLHLQLHNQMELLEEQVKEKTRGLEEARVEILQKLALAAEYREDPTGEHAKRVGETAAILARAANLPKAQVELIRLAAQLHDVGKIAVPETILRKPGPLTSDERDQMRLHAAVGARILSGSQLPLLQLAEEIALCHHEHWDGNGYASLKDQAIPVAARVVAIAEAFDVMTHDRPYRAAVSKEEALAEISRQSGRQFDPRLVDVFLRWHKKQDLPKRMRETILAG